MADETETSTFPQELNPDRLDGSPLRAAVVALQRWRPPTVDQATERDKTVAGISRMLTATAPTSIEHAIDGLAWLDQDLLLYAMRTDCPALADLWRRIHCHVVALPSLLDRAA